MFRPVRTAAADLAARACLRFPLLERAVAASTRRGVLHLGAVAHGYHRTLESMEVRLAELDRYRLFVNVAEPLGVQSYFFGNPCVPWFLSRLVRPGDGCIDAGANAGHFAMAMARLAGPEGRVVAVEANPALATLVSRSAQINRFDFVAVETRALWSTTGQTMRFLLSTNPANTGTSSLVNHGVHVSEETWIVVETITLDELAMSHGFGPVRLLKIDVERAEDYVLEGAQRLLALRLVDYVFVEMTAGGESQRLLEAAGYTGYFVPAEHKLIPAASVPGQYGDFLYVAPGLPVP